MLSFLRGWLTRSTSADVWSQGRESSEKISQLLREKEALRGQLKVWFGDIDLLEPAAEKSLPSVLIISAQKSGTVYINQLLSNGLGFKNIPISLQYFPRDLIDRLRLAIFARGNCVSSGHIDPSAHNLMMLRWFGLRWVVHVRDPRSIVVSLTHHLDRIWRIDKLTLLMTCPMPDDAYFAGDFREKLAWNIEHYLPSVVAWINAWLRIADQSPEEVLLTTYDEFHADESAYVRKVMKFYGIPEHSYTSPQLNKNVEQTHFREGKTEGWRDAIPADLLKRCNDAIGSDLFTRFGWSSD